MRMRGKIRYFIIPNDKKMNEYGDYSFILPLKDYSVGFDEYFTVDEINELSLTYNVSVIINRFIHEKDLELIKKEILKLNNIEYFFVDFTSIGYILYFNLSLLEMIKSISISFLRISSL